MTKRLENLDGLRSLAIVLVLGYHAFSRWPERMPYGDRFGDFPVFENGWLGVQLFFLISGFVIALSLDNSTNIREFLIKRWQRLFPAMAVVSLFILLTARFVTERPSGQPDATDFLPGLLFIEPYLLEKLIGLSSQSLEGGFWSLYVEVKFYCFSAIVYCIAGRKMLFFSLLACFAAAALLEVNDDRQYVQSLDVLHSIAHYASFIHFGWFAAGTAFYLHFHSNQRRYLAWAILSCAAASFVQGFGNSAEFAYCLAISAFFSLAVNQAKIMSLFKNKALVWLGFISYPLYLMHENLIVGLTVKFNKHVPAASGLVALFISIVITLLIAYAVAKYAEPNLRRVLKNVKA